MLSAKRQNSTAFIVRSPRWLPASDSPRAHRCPDPSRTCAGVAACGLSGCHVVIDRAATQISPVNSQWWLRFGDILGTSADNVFFGKYTIGIDHWHGMTIARLADGPISSARRSARFESAGAPVLREPCSMPF